MHNVQLKKITITLYGIKQDVYFEEGTNDGILGNKPVIIE